MEERLKEVEKDIAEEMRRRKIGRAREGTEKVEVEYRLLNDEEFRKNKFLRLSQLCVGDFVSQAKEKPVGMFVIRQILETDKKIIVEEIDCDPIHWKGEKGWAKGPDERCARKCEYYNNCPISAHIIITADID